MKEKENNKFSKAGWGQDETNIHFRLDVWQILTVKYNKSPQLEAAVPATLTNTSLKFDVLLLSSVQNSALFSFSLKGLSCYGLKGMTEI